MIAQNKGILLSFLSDRIFLEENFQFPLEETVTNSDYYEDAPATIATETDDRFTNSTDGVFDGIHTQTMQSHLTCSSPSCSSSDTDVEDLIFYDDLLDIFHEQKNYKEKSRKKPKFCADTSNSIDILLQIAPSSIIDEKKCSGNILSDNISNSNDNISLSSDKSGKKRKKASAQTEQRKNLDKKVKSLVSLLKRVKSISQVTPSTTIDPSSAVVDSYFSVAHTFLSAILCGNNRDLLSLQYLVVPNIMLQSQGLTSMHFESLQQISALKLSALSVPPVKFFHFSKDHVGLGQVSGISRSFVDALVSLLTPSIMNKITFDLILERKSSLVSLTLSDFVIPFQWKSTGMVNYGYPSEIELNGLLRCSFSKGLIHQATLNFDGCSIVRYCMKRF